MRKNPHLCIMRKQLNMGLLDCFCSDLFDLGFDPAAAGLRIWEFEDLRIWRVCKWFVFSVVFAPSLESPLLRWSFAKVSVVKCIWGFEDLRLKNSHRFSFAELRFANSAPVRMDALVKRPGGDKTICKISLKYIGIGNSNPRCAAHPLLFWSICFAFDPHKSAFPSIRDRVSRKVNPCFHWVLVFYSCSS
jgi:hypothetical protein